MQAEILDFSAMQAQPMFARLSCWLDHSAFPRIVDPPAEARKIAVARIVTGLILVWQCGLMLRDSWYYFEHISLDRLDWSSPALANWRWASLWDSRPPPAPRC